MESAEQKSVSGQLDNVRTAIDEIDEEIVALIWRRQRLVRVAGGLKDNDDAVRSPKRMEEVIAHVRHAAQEQDGDCNVVERTYKAMIEAFIDYELKVRHEMETQRKLDAFSRS
ncbi:MULTISPECIES: chorismate mutase [Arthrobacter]|uniref:Chorismate mutase n=1 Tax=Arthrobacter jinronghuae TaxID=2964609 RepID=A0ABT1NRN6_9MICC|nr:MULTISPECIES: chorismate mutase [Arthrobacter]MCQ1950389.1 chorismate mutase [Arthrobacter jinronghuae]MCQ1953212.1 chorismate mutase [Arthrobacter sp. zg-Y238]MCQ1956455.1 chorismate mutase [Arthrobacter jinronghuae]UWX77365.1 chorismate mutase [Arthrobacter jinronghuae]